MEDIVTYRRVTVVERRLIRMWRQAGYGQREIARRLGRSPSSICREIARNSGGNGYQAHQAQAMAQERAKRPGPRRFTEEVKEAAETRLKDGWTPDMISGRARLGRDRTIVAQVKTPIEGIGREVAVCRHVDLGHRLVVDADWLDHRDWRHDHAVDVRRIVALHNACADEADIEKLIGNAVFNRVACQIPWTA